MVNDAQTAAKVRKLIVANWFDVSQVRIRVVRGVVHLQGRIQKFGEDKGDRPQTAGSLHKLDENLHSLPGFRGVAYAFDNWLRESTGAWRYMGRDKDDSKSRKTVQTEDDLAADPQ